MIYKVYCKKGNSPSEYAEEFSTIRAAKQYVAWLISEGWDKAWIVNENNQEII